MSAQEEAGGGARYELVPTDGSKPVKTGKHASQPAPAPRRQLSQEQTVGIVAVCVLVITWALWTRSGNLQETGRPLRSLADNTNLYDASADDQYYAHPNYGRDLDDQDGGDEDILDEEHQQGIARMYPAHQQQSVSPNHKGRKFPGMSPYEGSHDWDYALTIDAGSSGSRLHIYKWLHRHSSSSIPPFSPLFTKHAWSAHVSPGISTFVDDPERVIPQLVELLGFARSSLSEFRHKWAYTPLYIKATAGMRLVRNLPSRDRIMDTIRNFLENDKQANPFYFDRSMARVISGEEEGVYGWMTANYLSGTLMHASSATALGALDMGGASVQITFRPPFDVLSNYFPLRLQQEKIRLYSHSFLRFGKDLALNRVNDRLIELGNNSTGTHHPVTNPYAPVGTLSTGVRVFKHPCFPTGFSMSYEYVSSTDLRASYEGQRHTGGVHSEEQEGLDMSPVTTWSELNAHREMVQFEGSQDFDSCSEITWHLLLKHAPCFDNTCSFDGQYQPRFGNVTFLAFSEFSKVVLQDLRLGHNATLSEINARSREMCALSWQTLQDTFRYAKVDTLSKLCFNSRYVFTVLYKGFGFPLDGRNLRFVTNLMDLDLNWALGSTLYEVMALPFDIDCRQKGDLRYNMPSANDHKAVSRGDPHLDRDETAAGGSHSHGHGNGRHQVAETTHPSKHHQGVGMGAQGESKYARHQRHPGQDHNTVEKSHSKGQQRREKEYQKRTRWQPEGEGTVNSPSSASHDQPAGSAVGGDNAQSSSNSDTNAPPSDEPTTPSNAEHDGPYGDSTNSDEGAQWSIDHAAAGGSASGNPSASSTVLLAGDVATAVEGRSSVWSYPSFWLVLVVGALGWIAAVFLALQHRRQNPSGEYEGIPIA